MTEKITKQMRETTESRRPSVFERLGPGASGGRDGGRQDKCRNWLRDGHCPFGSKCHFQHGPYRSSETDSGDLRQRVESKRAEQKKHSYDRTRSPSAKREKSKRNKDKDPERRKKKKSKELGSLVVKGRSVSSEQEDEGQEWDRYQQQDDWIDQDSEHERELESRRQELKRQLAQMEEVDSEREHMPPGKSSSESSSSSSSSSGSDSTSSSSSSSTSSSSDESASRSPSPVSRKSKKKLLKQVKRDKGHQPVEAKQKRGRSREKKYKSGKDKRIISPDVPTKRKHKSHSGLTSSKQVVSGQRSKSQNVEIQPKKIKHKEMKGKGKEPKFEGKSKDVEKKRKRSRSGPKDDKAVAKAAHQKKSGKNPPEVVSHKRASLTPPPRGQKGRGYTPPTSKTYSPSTPTQSESPYSVNRNTPSPVPQKQMPFERYRDASPSMPPKRGRTTQSYGTISQTSSRGPTPPPQFRKRPHSPSPSSSQRSYSPAVVKRSASPRPRGEHYRTSSTERYDSRKSGKYSTPTGPYKGRPDDIYPPQDHGRGSSKYYRDPPAHPHMPVDDRYRKYPPAQRHQPPSIQDNRRIRERGNFDDKRYDHRDHHVDSYYRKENPDSRKRQDDVRSISPSQKRRHLDSGSGRQRSLGQSPSPGPRDRRRDQSREDYRRPADQPADRRYTPQGRDRYKDWPMEEQRDYRKEGSKDRDARFKESGPAVQESFKPDEGRPDQGFMKRRREDDKSEQTTDKRRKVTCESKSVESDVSSKDQPIKDDVQEPVFSDWSDEEGSEELWNTDARSDTKKEEPVPPTLKDIQIKPVVEEHRKENREYRHQKDEYNIASERQERSRRSHSRGSTSSQQSSVSSDHKRQRDYYERERTQRQRSESRGIIDKTEVSQPSFQIPEIGKEIPIDGSRSSKLDTGHIASKEEVSVGGEVEESLKQPNMTAANENIYDSFSDDDDIEKVLHDDSGGSSVAEPKGEMEKVKDLLEVDWSVLKNYKAPTENTANQPGSALSRFTPGSILARIGVSSALAGPKLMKRVHEACKEATPEGGEVPKFDCVLGAFNAVAQQKAQQRKKLLSDVGPCRRALSARWDLQIRKQLRKSSRDIDSSMFSASTVDPELYKHSLQLFKSKTKDEFNYRPQLARTMQLVVQT